LGIGNKLRNGLGGNRWMHHHDVGHAEDACDGHDVAEEIVIELAFEERRIDRARRGDQQERITVRGRTHDRLGPNRGGRARPVLDHKWLSEALGKPLSHQARGDVGRAGGRERHDHAHPPPRIRLRRRDARAAPQRGSAGGQMQELPSAGKFHLNLPSRHSITSSARASNVAAARVTVGAISLRSSNNFALKSYSNIMKPVALPPGSARLSTYPAPTGSGTITNTTGMERVACSTGATPELPVATITSGARATNSAAYLRAMAGSPPDQRALMRTLPPSVQPNCLKVWRNTA